MELQEHALPGRLPGTQRFLALRPFRSVFHLRGDVYKRQELERITSELEGMIRRMDAMTDEAKRLKGMEGSELKKAESQERLHALADEEQTNRRELSDLLNRSEDLFKEASRNPQIDP